MQEYIDLSQITERIAAFPGKTGFYYKNLMTGDEAQINGLEPFLAASVIKLPILAGLFFEMEEGLLEKDEEFILMSEDRLPGCGAIQFLHDGICLTLEDLYTQMIVVSDNTAANLLIKRVGMDQLNRRMNMLGLSVTRLNRLLFDSDASERGIENVFAPEEIGRLLEGLFRGRVVSEAASDTMLSILSNQQLNGKIPFYLDEFRIAHKTGEDGGITHDVGIVFADQPFVLCLCGNGVNVPEFERLMQDTAFHLYKLQTDSVKDA